MEGTRKISMAEVKKHSTPDDCWVVLNGKVYDLSKFHSEHPGGSKLITNNAGKDATALFAPIHPKDIVQRLLPPESCIGLVDESTIAPEDVVAGKKVAPPRGSVNVVENSTETIREYVKPSLEQMLNVFDLSP